MATIRDVAREAGVSIATVSRVCAGSPRVSAATSRRVQEVSARLNYWPNGAARSLTTSRTQTLGVLLPDLYGEFYSEVIRGIDRAASLDGYQILVSSSHARSETLLAAARSMRGRVDGLIVMAPDEGSSAAIRRITQDVPVVLLNPRVELAECGAISVANFDGAHAITAHLLALGHRVIAMVRGPAGNVDAEERLRGYRAALRGAGLEPDPGLEREGDFTEGSGYQCAAAVLERRPRPTAVFAANDYMAIGLMGALRERGLEVPRAMSVAGFDDIAVAQYLSPPLTTVRVEAYELGRRAVGQLLDSAVPEKAAGNGGRGRAAPSSGRTHEVLPATLILRSTCGAPAGRRSRA